MITRVVAIVLLTCACACVSSQSQPTQPPSTNATEPDSAKGAQNEDRGQQQHADASNPLTAPRQPDAEQIKRETEYRQREIAIAESNRDLTRLLIVVGTIVGVLQVGLMFWTGLVSNKAANAAQKSADIAATQLTSTQRPFLLHGGFNYITIHSPLDGQLVAFGILPTLHNSGHTPALQAKCYVTRHLTSPHDLDHSGSMIPDGDLRQTSVITVAAGSGGFADTFRISAQEIDQVLRNEIAIFIHVYIEYKDPFKDTPIHHTATCMRVTLLADPKNLPVENLRRAFLFRGGTSEHNYAD